AEYVRVMLDDAALVDAGNPAFVLVADPQAAVGVDGDGAHVVREKRLVLRREVTEEVAVVVEMPDAAAEGGDVHAVVRGIRGDAPVVFGHEIPGRVVEGGMHVLQDSRATELTVAGRIPGEVRLAQSEAVIAAEPEVVRAVLIDDAPDAAELLAPAGFGRDDARSAEDVVMHDGDRVARQRDSIGVTTLV